MLESRKNTPLGYKQARAYLQNELGLKATDDNATFEEAKNAQQFAAYLIRTGYIIEVGNLIPPGWIAMTESELTALLKSKFTEKQLTELFLKKSAIRNQIKIRARNFSMIAAVAIALIWCREDLDSGEFLNAGLKFSATVGGTYLMNMYFYSRDKSALEIMKHNGRRFGKWFQGCARTNKIVNIFTTRITPALLAWDLRGWLMSGGYSGPNIPFDLISYIDIFDKSTWKSPPQRCLDLGLDFFYYQKSTARWPVGHQTVCLGIVRGSLLKGIAKKVFPTVSDLFTPKKAY